MTAYHDEIVPFVAGDGMACNLVHLVGESAPTRGPLILVHGAGVRANIFRAPIDQPLVDLLVADGYDVWLENWRASLDLKASQWTLDQAAAFDAEYPPRAGKLARDVSDRTFTIVAPPGARSSTGRNDRMTSSVP